MNQSIEAREAVKALEGINAACAIVMKIRYEMINVNNSAWGYLRNVSAHLEVRQAAILAEAIGAIE